MRMIMKSVILLSHFFILSLILFEIGEGTTINYGSLIKDVYDKYRTDSIIIVPVKNYFSFERILILQKISKELSTNGISSVVVNFMRLGEAMKLHSSTSHRPLVVIFINEITEIHKFRVEMMNIDRSNGLQLILFTGDGNEDHCRYCRDPFGNSFNLKFNSEILVSCCDSDYIEKWWSESENQTSKIPNAKWIAGENKLDWYPNNTLHNHRQSMQINELRIVIVKGTPYVRKENDQLHGYLGALALELSRYLKFNISHIIEEDTYGYWDSESSMWVGAIGTVVKGTADMGVGIFIMNVERLSAVDFTVPILSCERALFIKKPAIFGILWNACFKPLHAEIWMVTIVLLWIIPLLLTMIKYKRKDNFLDTICEHYLSVWGIFCQRPLPDSPQGAPLRIVYISTQITALVLYAAFSASFISWLSTTSSKLPFHTLREFVDDGTYNLIMRRDNPEYESFQVSNDTVSRKMQMMIESRDSWPVSRKEGFEQICGEKKAFYDWDLMGQSHHFPCEIVTIKVGQRMDFGMILPFRSEYTNRVNHYILQFEYNGMLRRWKDKYLRGRTAILDTPYEPVTFERIIPILIAFGIGFSIAFIIFCIEIP